MTKLLEQVIQRLRQLPAPMQDSAARALFLRLEEEPEPGDLEMIAEAREAYRRGDYIRFDDWRHEMDIGDC